MYYLALLIGPQQERTPDEAAQELTDYLNFQAKAASSIRAGDALYPEADSVRITGGSDAPVITDGPFAEGAEVANGYYVLEADNLDDALALARDIPEAKRGAVEVWPLIDCSREFNGQGATNWLALLLEPCDGAYLPGSPEWEAVAAQHAEFGAKAGDHIKIAGPLHPPSTATTVRVRDGEVLLTDGPYIEGAEIANGFYVLTADGRDKAVELAAQLPASTVELRQLTGVSGF
ncbi:DGPFAETKE family protein [Mycobacteroides abscessus subsp. bolletii]|uniref:YciI family protein n=1 Tax=Mycobacteroides abscessus TaxID=36809 RepID=UPI00092C7AE4|nr:YciI family protein [Mycobacteroides abscessus]SHX45098.1 DGPFAETKE family protein [Mycobacteroides abscessus subsp. bolletii]SKP67900.1 DGPFAETKE family protein [Mycobacteroides abscessus subsp. bolletii]SKP69427.1 DGPFAETKE family protein [Mycobacteroides abscessus subsp. bolletii]SKQ27850.1 DGPFAETKE family protein [Mycobacteroides abscessus subsp. bolletii]